ncbi:hypothetical protein GGU11DRAFT_760950 [Lentinula aff. detonsa]|nr:hypothetical protein GGU11DRAFT_760950 [Lentinula aff. detonsa]
MNHRKWQAEMAQWKEDAQRHDENFSNDLEAGPLPLPETGQSIETQILEGDQPVIVVQPERMSTRLQGSVQSSEVWELWLATHSFGRTGLGITQGSGQKDRELIQWSQYGDLQGLYILNKKGARLLSQETKVYKWNRSATGRWNKITHLKVHGSVGSIGSFNRKYIANNEVKTVWFNHRFDWTIARAYSEEQLLMELLDQEKEDEILDDGALEGSGDKYNGHQ